jgi:hypothetical protein
MLSSYCEGKRGEGREKTNFESFFRITESNRLQVVPVKLFLTVPIVL